MKVIIPIVFVLASFFVVGQRSDTLFLRYDTYQADTVTYRTDTLFRTISFEPLFLFETAWIPNTSNQLEAIGYGIFPKKVWAKCEGKGIESGQNELISLTKTDTTLTVIYRVVSNCCFSFLCDLEIVDSNTLNLKYIEYGNVCGCTCYHSLSFELSVEDYDKEFLANFQKLKFLTLNGELKTKFE